MSTTTRKGHKKAAEKGGKPQKVVLSNRQGRRYNQINDKSGGKKGAHMKTKKFTRKEIVKDWKKNKLLYLMAVPLIAFFIVFAYLPMGGILMAFENYKQKLGIFRSQGVGLENFKTFFNRYLRGVSFGIRLC